MTEPIPNPNTWYTPRPCGGEDHARWAKILIDWCLSRTPTSLERRDGGVWYILGTERAAAANALPRQIVARVDASAEHYTPTDAALVAMLDDGLRHLGHRWDPITETVQLTNPIRALRIPSMPIIHLFDTNESFNDRDTLWDEDDCRIDWPEVEPVDCDWRIEDEFSPDGRLSLNTGTLPDTDTETATTPTPPTPDRGSQRATKAPDLPAAEPAGDIGQTITVTGTVITAGRLPPNRWNTKPRALLILNHGSGRVKTVTSAAWAYRVTTGQQLTLTGTVTGHATSHGLPLTIVARPRPRPDTRPAQPPAAGDPGSEPPVWEVIRPAPGKARPYPTRPTHWPRRRPRRGRPGRPDQPNGDRT